MKLTKKDGVYLIYKGLERLVVEYQDLGREGTKSPTHTIYTLIDGTRIINSHFKYGLAKIPCDTFTWCLKLHYRASVVSGLLMKDNPLLSMIPKDSNWAGAYLPIPLVQKC